MVRRMDRTIFWTREGQKIPVVMCSGKVFVCTFGSRCVWFWILIYMSKRSNIKHWPFHNALFFFFKPINNPLHRGAISPQRPPVQHSAPCPVVTGLSEQRCEAARFCVPRLRILHVSRRLCLCVASGPPGAWSPACHPAPATPPTLLLPGGSNQHTQIALPPHVHSQNHSRISS